MRIGIAMAALALLAASSRPASADPIGPWKITYVWNDDFVRRWFGDPAGPVPGFNELASLQFDEGEDANMDPFPEADARAIAGGCVAAFADVWDRIHCASGRTGG